MIQTLSKNWLLLALCGVFEAIIAVVYLIMLETVTFHSNIGTITLLGKLTLAAGACAIAAGIARSAKGKCWFLVLNGLALAALGIIQYAFIRYPISLLTVALLIVLMAIAIGILELQIARTLRHQRHVMDGCLFAVAGVASACFALAFLALGFHWIKIEPGSHIDLLLFGAYFGFSAISMLAMALRLHSQGFTQSRGAPVLRRLGNPRHAH
jgi:uncharacterized membrane protein HdeD (DUF308 family)